MVPCVLFAFVRFVRTLADDFFSSSFVCFALLRLLVCFFSLPAWNAGWGYQISSLRPVYCLHAEFSSTCIVLFLQSTMFFKRVFSSTQIPKKCKYLSHRMFAVRT